VSGFLLAQSADVAKNTFLIVTDFLVMLFTLFFLFSTASICSIGCIAPCRSRCSWERSAVVSTVRGGIFFVWGLVALYLFVIGPVWKGAIMIAVGGGLVGLMDNVLQPYLIGSGARLPVLALFFASVGGAYFGFIGLFLDPILVDHCDGGLSNL